ncbi:MAG: TIR domain-containing protein [Nitrosopumilaceae archaeon]|nr:TIR domain-containing protein [Nitrosopumilaceae archaeon]
MHKVFISYHHNDQPYKDKLVEFAEKHRIFIDKSVDTQVTFQIISAPSPFGRRLETNTSGTLR